MTDFKFTNCDTDSIKEIIHHYNNVFNNYFKEVLKSEGKSLDFNFKLNCNYLSIINLDSPNSYVDFIKYQENNKELRNIVFSKMMEVSSNYNLLLIGTINFEEYSNYMAFKFYIGGQNNCCGALTITDTYVGHAFRYNKIGTILQYMKEDLANAQRVTLLTCTDIISVNGNEYIENSSYLPNHSLLLKHNWKLKDYFYNRKSSNTVGLFVKNINNYKSKIITLKLKNYKQSAILNRIEDITIGCDPELFLKVKNIDEFVPSFMVMEGNKLNPTKITDAGHNIQCDNVMVEYGIPPCKTEDEFVENNKIALDYIKSKVAEPNDLEMVIYPAVKFSINNLKDDRAKVFGCDPDYNAWLGGRPNKVGDTRSTLRCAG